MLFYIFSIEITYKLKRVRIIYITLVDNRIHKRTGKMNNWPDTIKYNEKSLYSGNLSYPSNNKECPQSQAVWFLIDWNWVYFQIISFYLPKNTYSVDVTQVRCYSCPKDLILGGWRRKIFGHKWMTDDSALGSTLFQTS